MSPVAMVALLIFNTAALFVSLSVFVLALWQNPGTPFGTALERFLASLVFLNITVVGTFLCMVLWGSTSQIGKYISELSVTAYALSSMLAFGLIIHAADEMKNQWQVLSRAGIVIIFLLQVPLFSDQLFATTSDVSTMLVAYSPAGAFAGSALFAYIVMGLVCAYVWRRRINQPLFLLGLVGLLIGQAITLIVAPLRMIAFPSLLSGGAGMLIGYSLIKLQLFSPLMLRAQQLHAVRELALAVSSRRGLQTMLESLVDQAQQLLHTAVVVVFLVDRDGKLVVAAHKGGKTSLKGRIIYEGEGLAGRVLQLQSAMSLPSYRNWEGRASTFDDQGFCASLSVPIIDGDDIVGVLNIHETEPGRVFNKRDTAVAELLAAQAAVGIMNERMRSEIEYWRTRAKGIDKRSTNSIHFDEQGTLILGLDMGPDPQAQTRPL